MAVNTVGYAVCGFHSHHAPTAVPGPVVCVTYSTLDNTIQYTSTSLLVHRSTTDQHQRSRHASSARIASSTAAARTCGGTSVPMPTNCWMSGTAKVDGGGGGGGAAAGATTTRSLSLSSPSPPLLELKLVITDSLHSTTTRNTHNACYILNRNGRVGSSGTAVPADGSLARQGLGTV